MRELFLVDAQWLGLNLDRKERREEKFSNQSRCFSFVILQLVGSPHFSGLGWAAQQRTTAFDVSIFICSLAAAATAIAVVVVFSVSPELRQNEQRRRAKSNRASRNMEISKCTDIFDCAITFVQSADSNLFLRIDYKRTDAFDVRISIANGSSAIHLSIIACYCHREWSRTNIRHILMRPPLRLSMRESL